MFDKEEILHILISVITISLAFSMTALRAPQIIPAFFANFPLVLVTLGSGFILHELAHKWVAIKMGCMAVYRMWWAGLAIALGLGIMTQGSLIFAAPGAVYIGGRNLTIREDGIISAVGPLTNLILGLIFLVIATLSTNNLLIVVGSVGAYINFFLAFFNLLPFPPIDGSKVIRWNVGIWAVMIGLAGYLTFLL